MHAGANLALAWAATDHSQLQLGAGIGYLHYFKNSQNGGLEVTPDSALSYQVNFADGNLALYDQINYSRQVIQEAALANVATLPRLDNTVGARVTWQPGRWELQGGYSHENYLSTSGSFQYLNRSSESLFTRDGWRFAEATQAGLEASGGLTRYEQSLQSDDRNLSLGLYADWQVTKDIHATVRGGSAEYFFDAPRGSKSTSATGSTLSSYYAGLDASHQLNEFFTHSISLQRSTSAGINQGSSYVQQIEGAYSFSWSLRSSFTLGGQVSYLLGNQPLPLLANGQEHFTSYRRRSDFGLEYHQ